MQLTLSECVIAEILRRVSLPVVDARRSTAVRIAVGLPQSDHTPSTSCCPGTSDWQSRAPRRSTSLCTVADDGIRKRKCRRSFVPAFGSPTCRAHSKSSVPVTENSPTYARGRLVQPVLRVVRDACEQAGSRIADLRLLLLRFLLPAVPPGKPRRLSRSSIPGNPRFSRSLFAT